MKLWVHRYELRARARLNARAEGVVYPGALIRDERGFANVHPWPTLGDRSLEEILGDLQGCRLGRRSLACLKADGEARERGVSLCRQVEVPVSHATMVEPGEVPPGFSHAKLKVAGNLAEVRECLRGQRAIRWRLDFNGTGDPEMFREWEEEELDLIDFVEDPFPPELGNWRSLPVTTGNDRFLGGGEVQVLKPAVDEMVWKAGRQVVTSSMDHPLGQAFAAWEAGRIGTKEVCGLQTHGLFEATEFTEALGSVRPQFCVPEGVGLGFGELLDNLDWSVL